jgi:hypothetical protein
MTFLALLQWHTKVIAIRYFFENVHQTLKKSSSFSHSEFVFCVQSDQPTGTWSAVCVAADSTLRPISEDEFPPENFVDRIHTAVHILRLTRLFLVQFLLFRMCYA